MNRYFEPSPLEVQFSSGWGPVVPTFVMFAVQAMLAVSDRDNAGGRAVALFASCEPCSLHLRCLASICSLYFVNALSIAGRKFQTSRNRCCRISCARNPIPSKFSSKNSCRLSRLTSMLYRYASLDALDHASGPAESRRRRYSCDCCARASSMASASVFDDRRKRAIDQPKLRRDYAGKP